MRKKLQIARINCLFSFFHGTLRRVIPSFRVIHIILASLFLFCIMVKPAFSEIVIQDIVVIWEGPDPESVNLRVNLHNGTRAAERGPIAIHLYVRKDNTEKWRPVKSWKNISKIPPGHRMCRDYHPGAENTMDQALYTGAFQLRATVTAPDGREGWREEEFPVLYIIPELGITVEKSTPGIAERLGVISSGVMVREVSPNGPAAAAGLREKDVILEIGETLVLDVEELVERISRESPGADLKFSYFRDYKRKSTSVRINSLPVTMVEKEEVRQSPAR